MLIEFKLSITLIVVCLISLVMCKVATDRFDKYHKSIDIIVGGCTAILAAGTGANAIFIFLVGIWKL